MAKKQPLLIRSISILLIGLTAYSLSACASLAPTIPENQRPPMPLAPKLEKVTFESRPNGLFLSFEEYRQLEENIIEMRRYIKELEAQIYFYTGEINE